MDSVSHGCLKQRLVSHLWAQHTADLLKGLSSVITDWPFSCKTRVTLCCVSRSHVLKFLSKKEEMEKATLARGKRVEMANQQASLHTKESPVSIFKSDVRSHYTIKTAINKQPSRTYICNYAWWRMLTRFTVAITAQCMWTAHHCVNTRNKGAACQLYLKEQARKVSWPETGMHFSKS